MSEEYGAVKKAMCITEADIDKVLQLLDGLYDTNGHHIFNTIMAAKLTAKQRNFAFFMWGVNLGIASEYKRIVDTDDDEEEEDSYGY